MAFAFQMPHGWMDGRRFRLKVDAGPFHAGDIVKCVMVSRLGDCGITKNLKVAAGYKYRVPPHELECLEDEVYDMNSHIAPKLASSAMFVENYQDQITPWTKDVLKPGFFFLEPEEEKP